MSYSKTHVIVAMSGGVDSSVAAYLLLEQGYQVEGMFMKNWEEDDTDSYCAASKDLADAQAICDQLKIPLHRVNFSAEYWDEVFANFLAEYESGRTPNPDIACNKEIKFKAFLEHARHLGAEFIATGHYARVRCQDGIYQLLAGTDLDKDQSYFLYTLNQEQLKQTLFPIGTYNKTEIRTLAERLGFNNFSKKSSTGICFIGPRKFKDFLKKYIKEAPGLIETPEGKVVGQHQGLMFYTLGQRQGLGIGGLRNAAEAPWYVVAKDQKRNALIVSQETETDLLCASKLCYSDSHWVAETSPKESLICSAKIRYRQTAQACKLISDNQVEFVQPQRAITPGQSIVFYQDDICLGGGVIETSERI